MTTLVNTSNLPPSSKSSKTDEANLKYEPFLEPYKGLDPYTEEDSEKFCCRDLEIDTIITNLKLWRFMILYGKSGVGKSSIIHAGVVHNLLEEAKDNIINYGFPKLAVVVFPLEEGEYLSNSSIPDILKDVKKFIEKQIQSLNEQIYNEGYPLSIDFSLDSPTDSLKETLNRWSQQIQGTIYFIFDQFEGHFFEDNFPNDESTLAVIGAINDWNIPLHSLVVIRDDFLANLDSCLKGKIDDLFEHRLELKNLTYEQAKEAIIKPLKIYNQNKNCKSVDEDVLELLETILCQGEVGDGDKEPIELLLLQLIMKAIWEDEFKNCNEQNKSKIELKKETFEKLERTQGIARKYLGKSVENLIDEIIKFEELKNYSRDDIKSGLVLLSLKLVSSAARQIPQTAQELCEDELIQQSFNYYNLEALLDLLKDDNLEKLLDILVKHRVLRLLPDRQVQVSDNPNESRQKQYEIFHKRFCDIILKWQNEEIRKLEEKRTKKELQTFSLVAQNLAFQTSQKSQNQEYDLSLLLACQAYRFSQKNPEGQGLEVINSVLRDLLRKPDVFKIGYLLKPQHDKQVSAVAFSPQGKWLASGSYDQTVNILDAHDLETSFCTLTCPDGQIWSIAFSPDENKLAFGSDQGTIYLADLTKKNPQLDCLYPYDQQTQNEDDKNITSLAFSPDGKYLVSGSWDTTVKIFDLQNSPPKIIHTLTHKDWVWSVAFNPNPKKPNQLAVGCRNGTVILWNLKSLKSQKLSTHIAKNWNDHSENILWEREVFCVAFSPDGKYLASGGRDTIVRLWDLEHLDNSLRASQEFIGHQNMVKSLTFSPDGKFLLSGSEDKTIRVWDFKEKKSLSKRNKLLSMVLKGHNEGVNCLAFNPNITNPMLVSGSWNNQVLKWQWKPDHPTSVMVLKGHKGVVKAVEFCKDDNWLISTGYDRTVKGWQLIRDPKEPSIIVNNTVNNKPTDFLLGEEKEPPKEFRTLALSQKTQKLAAAGIDGRVRVWDINDPEKEPILLTDHQSEVRSLAFSPNGQWLASGGSEPLVNLWKYENNYFIFQQSQSKQLSDKLQELGDESEDTKNYQKTVRTLTFSPNGQWLLTGGEDHILRLWDVNNYEEPISSKNLYEAITWVAFSPEGNYMAAATELENIYLWPIEPNSPPNLDNNLAISWRGGCITFSPNSKKLASSDRSGAIYLWDVEQSKTPPIILEGHRHAIRAIAFSSDGKYLASGSDDQTIRIWVVETETLARMACKRVSRSSLSREEWNKFIGDELPYQENTCPIS